MAAQVNYEVDYRKESGHAGGAGGPVVAEASIYK